MKSTGHSRVLRAALVATALNLSAGAIHAATPSETPVEAPRPTAVITQETEADIQDLMYLSKKRLAFVRLHIRIDGRGFRSLQDDYSTDLFRTLDADSNGVLDSDEITKLPPASRMSPPGRMSMRFRSWRTRNKAGEPDADVTPDELKQYVRAVAGTPFSVAALQSGNQVQVDLFPKLDRNSDDVLDAEELEAARSTLQSFDINDDEMISLTELRSDGGSRYFGYQVRGSATNGRASKIVSSFVVVDTERPIAALQKLLQTYDTFVRDKTSGARLKDSRLSRSELNMNEALFKQYDTNDDETLAKDELIALLRAPQPDVEIAVDLKRGENDKATIRLLSAPGDFADGEIVARPDSDRSMRLTINKLEAIVKPDLDDASTQNYAQNYTARFKQADMDNNEYLDRNEIRFINIASRDFGRMDADRDGKIFLKEITGYIDDMVKLGKSLTALVVSDDNVTPFQLLDVNNDGRLSPRELGQAVVQFVQWDENSDRAISRNEVPDDTRIWFETGRPNLFGNVTAVRQRVTQRRKRPEQNPKRTKAEKPPEWFAKMDHNRDGDVSRREFLGPTQLFSKLDLDSDGLLNSKEAAAEKREDSEKPK